MNDNSFSHTQAETSGCARRAAPRALPLRIETSLCEGPRAFPGYVPAGARAVPAWQRESCPYRRSRSSRVSFSPHLPPYANGRCFPGDEAGDWCDLSLDRCDPHPDACPLWAPSDLACPLCLEFVRRRWPTSVFNEARLLSRAGRLPIQGGAYCSVCGEWYEGEGAIVLAALGRLRDLLDDLDHARLRREGAQDAGGAG